MPRDVSTPLVLWICAAICAHLVFGEGGEKAAQLHDDHSQLYGLIMKAHERTVIDEQTFEVALADDTPVKIEEPKASEEPPKDEPNKDAPTPPDKADETKHAPVVTPPPPPTTPPPQPKVEPPKPKPEPPKPPEPKKPEPTAPPPPPPPKPKDDEQKPQKLPDPIKPDQRIAVIQQAKPDQKDNPNAHYIADQANHVDQETASHLTNHEKDEANPTPGGNHTGPTRDPGDSDRNKIADTADHPGEQQRAPGERGTDLTLVPQAPPSPQPAATTLNPPAPQPPPAPPHAGDNRPAAPAPAVQPAPAPTQAPGGEGQAAPKVEDSPNGGWSFNPARPTTGTGAGPSQQQGPGRAGRPPQAVNPVAPMFGLGVRSQPGQINFNLNQQQVAQIVGQDQLRRDRENDGERRRSEHRGSWQASNFDRWRSAIENYVPSVRDGNQTALNTAAVPFGTYLNLMHNRIHPIFADSFLLSLDSLPPGNPLNDQSLITSLEIVLTKDGHLQRMGIVKTSGVTAFDIAALDSVNRAQPFGPAPGAIVSPDGNVYLHWEFHRDEVFACSTMNARPFILKASPASPGGPPVQPPGNPPGPHERGLPPPSVDPHETRTGALEQLLTHGPG